MKFTATLKEIKRFSTSSLDVEYSIRLITEQNLQELMSVQADELVEVEIRPWQEK